MVPQLHAHHDIVIIDPRGTGHSGAIDCPDLQKTSSAPNVARAFVGACGASLGAAADRYGAADRVTDLDDVRQRLGYDSIDYYGPSAGSWDAQAYAHRFHQHLHAVVLDSGFPTTATPPDYNDFWFTGAPAELLRVVALSCARDANCHGRDPDPTSTLTKLAEQLRRTPISTLDESGLVALILDADPVGVVEAADDARSGTTDPIIKLLADTRGGDKRSIANYSAGDNAAGICNDVDTPWSRTDSPAVRRKKIDAALATMPVDAYAPFSKEAWTDNEAWDFCVDWPAPTRYEPVVPPGAPPVSTPALVLSGELDRQVPSFSSRTLLQQFTKATFLIVNDAQHVTVAGPGTCAADIVAQFFDTLDAGSPTCAVPG
jgi:pimeloyl-ACP methyl ester carboxylesterase